MINVWVDAPSSWKIMEGISSQVCILSRQYSFQASLYVVSATCWSIYLERNEWSLTINPDKLMEWMFA